MARLRVMSWLAAAVGALLLPLAALAGYDATGSSSPEPFHTGLERIAATLDITPDSLQKRSQGSDVTAYIELPADFDVANIDTSTVQICREDAGCVSARPHPTGVDDYDHDGIPDLMVKFDRYAVIDLVADVTAPDTVTFTVSGILDPPGRSFAGSDTVRLVDPDAEPSSTPSLSSTPAATAMPTPTATPFPTPTAAGTPPSNLTCANTGFFSRQLQWQPSPLADSYRIYHDGPFWADDLELLEDVAAPATTYEKVWPSFFRHRWYVTTLLGSWESGPSNMIEAHCRPALFFPGPFGLDGESHHSQRAVSLTWEPTAAATIYGVFRAEQSGGPYELVGMAQDSPYDDYSVAEGITYYYVAVALDGAGNESDPSLEIAVPDLAPALSPTATAIPTVEPTATQTPEPAPAEEPDATATEPAFAPTS